MSATPNPRDGADEPRRYVTPRLERLGTFRELTLAGGGGNCDPSLVLGPETGSTGGNLGRCYE
ncbi:MAG TPA: lasso RiPP family leader peptide-containing protein [Gemmatimonadales bacterium]